MEITIKITDRRDAVLAHRIMAAISAAYGDIDHAPDNAAKPNDEPAITIPEVVLEPPRRRGRPKKAETETIDVATPTTALIEPINGFDHEVTALTAPQDLDEPPPSTEALTDPDAARLRLKEMVHQKGIVWIRPILAARGITRWVDLSDAQVLEITRGG
jgi:hypothetical protein